MSLEEIDASDNPARVLKRLLEESPEVRRVVANRLFVPEQDIEVDEAAFKEAEDWLNGPVRETS